VWSVDPDLDPRLIAKLIDWDLRREGSMRDATGTRRECDQTNNYGYDKLNISDCSHFLSPTLALRIGELASRILGRVVGPIISSP
jgi:hypothetical protein